MMALVVHEVRLVAVDEVLKSRRQQQQLTQQLHCVGNSKPMVVLYYTGMNVFRIVGISFDRVNLIRLKNRFGTIRDPFDETKEEQYQRMPIYQQMTIIILHYGRHSKYLVRSETALENEKK
jgi:hypothetical protein